MVNTWESLRFLAALSSPAHKCILKRSNLFWWRVISKQWLPGETGEHAQLHLDMSTERTTSHTQANWFARGWAQPERPSPCWLSSRGAQQHSGLDPPLQAEPDLGFQQTHEPHRKVGKNSGSFWKILDSQIQTSCTKKSNAAQHRLTGGQQTARQGVPLERLWWKVLAATQQYLQHELTDPHKIPKDGYRGTAFCHPLPLVNPKGPPPLPWNSLHFSLRPCAAHGLEKPPATSGWWGEAQTNPATTVTMAKCPACSWKSFHYTSASPRAGW